MLSVSVSLGETLSLPNTASAQQISQDLRGPGHEFFLSGVDVTLKTLILADCCAPIQYPFAVQHLYHGVAVHSLVCCRCSVEDLLRGPMTMSMASPKFRLLRVPQSSPPCIISLWIFVTRLQHKRCEECDVVAEMVSSAGCKNLPQSV